MNDKNRTAIKRRTFTAAALLGAATLPAFANEWPSKPLRIIVNFPPGSSPDIVARAVATPLSQSLGQPVVVDNRAGAGGIIGATAVARSPADGYTFLLSSGSTMSILPHIASNLSFEPQRDLVPVAGGARIELFLLVRSELPFKDFKSMVDYAKQNPGKLKFASPGNGTAPHVAGEMLKAAAGIDALHVPYKGSSAALQDLLAGQVEFAFDPGVGLPHVRSGKLRMLAVGSKRRLQQFPDTLTLQELGLPGFDAGTTHAFYAPAKTPNEIIERMHGAINAALKQQEVQSAIRSLGGEPSVLSIPELIRVSADDSQRYAAVVKSAKISSD